MAEEAQEPYNLMCSGCYTPCSGADAHVVPHWRPELHMVFTAYRCGNCWLPALAELRAAVSSGERGLYSSFCEFLTRHGYAKDSDMIRAAEPELQRAYQLAIVDAVERGELVFQP
jgi:hypothetical protein